MRAIFGNQRGARLSVSEFERALTINKRSRNMHKVIVGLAVTAMLAACSSTPTSEQPGAKIEDRTATPGTSTPKGPSTGGVAGDKIPSVEVKPPPSTPGDMAGELGKRSIYFDFDSNTVKEEFRPTVAAHARN